MFWKLRVCKLILGAIWSREHYLTSQIPPEKERGSENLAEICFWLREHSWEFHYPTEHISRHISYYLLQYQGGGEGGLGYIIPTGLKKKSIFWWVQTGLFNEKCDDFRSIWLMRMSGQKDRYVYEMVIFICKYKKLFDISSARNKRVCIKRDQIYGIDIKNYCSSHGKERFKTFRTSFGYVPYPLTVWSNNSMWYGYTAMPIHSLIFCCCCFWNFLISDIVYKKVFLTHL